MNASNGSNGKTRRRPMILSPHGGQANASDDDLPMTRAEVQALLVEVAGALADSLIQLEKKHNALVEALGLTYHPPHDPPSQEAHDERPGDWSGDMEEAVFEPGVGGQAPEAVEAEAARAARPIPLLTLPGVAPRPQ